MNSRVLQSLKVVLPLTIAGFVAFADNSPGSAQLTPDNTLGSENSIVTPQQLRDLIQGGAIRGNALFHSFDEFNVGSDRGVFFDLQNNTDILNVFTRVTGGNVSNILGTLGILQDALNSDVLGNANLFLLNPNGITFGANANLQLNGSFFATTADGFGFDNFTFSASGQEAPPPLLTVSMPRFASFRGNPGDIAVNQSNLTVNQGQNISLVGGNVSVAGSGDINNLQGSLTAPGGRIELGGLTVAGTVNINPDFSLVFPDGVARGDVSLTDESNINTDVFGGVGNAGDIQITTNTLNVNSGADISTDTFGVGNAGNILINATGDVTIDGEIGQTFTIISSNVNAGAQGDAGDITINAASFSLLNSAQIQTGLFVGGEGNAGNLLINVTGDVTIGGGIFNDIESGVIGNAGNVTIQAGGNVTFNDGVINTSIAAGAQGNSGNITITGNSTSIDGGFLDSRNFSSGNAGNITLNASETVSITNESFISTGGNLGDVSIGNPLDGDTAFTPRQVTIDSSFISSINNVVSAPEFDSVEIDTGNISIYALESISFTNTQGTLSAIGTSTNRLGDAGNVTLQTLDSGQITFDNIIIQTVVGGVLLEDGTIIDQGTGNAGTLEIVTGSLNVTNDSFIDSSTSGIGNAGLITITAAESVSITGASDGDSSDINNSVFNLGVGNGNDIIINTPSLFLSNGDISTATTGQGNAGNLQINASDSVTLTNGSSLFTNSFSQGDAGNINIEAGDGTVSLDDSSLVTSVLSGTIQGEDLVGNGNAGDININAGSISLTNGTQINSSVSSGIGDAGEVNLNAEDTVLLDNSSISTPSSITEETIESLEEALGSEITDLSSPGASGNTTISANSVVITNNAQISSATPGIANAGNVEINANSLSFTDGGQINSSTSGQGNAGDITLNVSDLISLDNLSRISSEVNETGLGSAGSIEITTDSLSLTNGAQIRARTFGQGNAGNITISASDLISLGENSFIATVVGSTGIGNAGDIALDARSLSLTNNAQISASTSGQGNAGAITLDVTDLISLDNLSLIDSQVGNGGQGNAGGISIDSGSLEMSNSSFLRANVEQGGNGVAGNVDIQTDFLTLRSGSQIQATVFRTFGDAPGGIGQSGNITINAEEFVDISGISETGFSTGILASAGRESRSLTSGTQTAGNIDITTGDFRIADGAVISAITGSDDFNGGNITITADDFSATGGGQIVSTTRAGGNAGNIKLDVSDTITISGSDPNFQDRINLVTEQIANTTDTLSDVIANQGAASGIFANTEVGSTGAGGSINIDPEIITVEDGGAISVDSQGTGIGGTLDITSDVVLLRNGNGTPLISANSQSDGGNITINTTALVALPGENSDITANSIGGLGGRIIINADNVLGIQAQEELTEGNDITVISGLGSQFNGQVTLDNPENQINQETLGLPEEVVDGSEIVTQSACYDFGGDSQLANTGRGGIPQIPGLVVRNSVVNVDLVDEVLPAPPPEAIKPHHRTDVTFLDSNGEEFKPAMGAVLLPNGMVEFVDYNPAEVYRDMYAAAGCSG